MLPAIMQERKTGAKERLCTVAADATMASRGSDLFARQQPPIHRYLTRHSYSIQCENRVRQPYIEGNLHPFPLAAQK